MLSLHNDPIPPLLYEIHSLLSKEEIVNVSESSRPPVVSNLKHDGDIGEISLDNNRVKATQALVQHFLTQFSYIPPRIPEDPQLRHDVANLIASWNVGVAWSYIEALTETSCSIAESAYSHTSNEHQRLVAIYTACLTFADDLGQQNLEALGQFIGRFARGEPQLHPALNCLVKLLGTLHEFCPRISADAIISSTVDSISAMYIEVITQGDVISPYATKYPFYLRLKTGIAPAYAHLNFTKSWGDDSGTGASYLQLLPEFETVIIGFNDILSFYKESLAGETNNYISMRAAVEQKTTTSVLQLVVEENLASAYKLRKLASPYPTLTDICTQFLMGYIEFHFKARRYRLNEIVETK